MRRRRKLTGYQSDLVKRVTRLQGMDRSGMTQADRELVDRCEDSAYMDVYDAGLTLELAAAELE